MNVTSPIATNPPSVMTHFQTADAALSRGITALTKNDERGFDELSAAYRDIELGMSQLASSGPALLAGRALTAVEDAVAVAEYSEQYDGWDPEPSLLNGPAAADQAREAQRILQLLPGVTR